MVVFADAAGRARARGPGGTGSSPILTGNSMLEQYQGKADANGIETTPSGESVYGTFQTAMEKEYERWRHYWVTPGPTRKERGLTRPEPPTGLPETLAPSPYGAGGLYVSSGQPIAPMAPPPTTAGGGGGRRKFRMPGGEEEKEKRDKGPTESALIGEHLAREAKQQREADRQRLLDLAKKAQLIGEEYLPSELDAIWQAAVDQAQASAMMGEATTPWDILEFWANDPVQARKYGGALQPSAPDIEEITPPLTLEERTSVSTSTSTAISDPRVAKVVLRNGLRAYLGRQPRDEEVAEFTQYLNDLERANPTVTKQTTIVGAEPGDETTSETVTTGGAPTADVAAQEYLEEDEEFSDEEFAYRMGTEGADVMRALVGSLV